MPSNHRSRKIHLWSKKFYQLRRQGRETHHEEQLGPLSKWNQGGVCVGYALAQTNFGSSLRGFILDLMLLRSWSNLVTAYGNFKFFLEGGTKRRRQGQVLVSDEVIVILVGRGGYSVLGPCFRVVVQCPVSVSNIITEAVCCFFLFHQNHGVTLCDYF